MPNGPFYGEGVHVVQITKQGLTKASTGTPQFVLSAKILGAPTGDGGYLPHQQQYERTLYMALTENTMQYVMPKLETLGFQGSSMGQLDPSHPSHQSFVGGQVDLYCKWENDPKGGQREKWQISTGPGSLGDPLDQREVRQLDALFGRMLKPAHGGPVAVQAQRDHKPASGQYFPPPHTDETQITDDDIPF